MVNTLVYWSGKPIGMRRRATLGFQAQVGLLVAALTAFLALATVRVFAFGRARIPTFGQRKGPELSLSPATPRALHLTRTTFKPLLLHGDYRTEVVVPTLYPYSRLIQRVAVRYDLPPDLVAGVVQTESQFDPRCVSPVGAEGLMQLMPSTAWLLARRLGWHHLDLFDPGENLVLGTFFLKDLLVQFGDLRTALSYYNAGQWGIVSRGVYRNPSYIRSVLSNFHQFGAEHDALLTVRPVLGRLQVGPILAAE